MFGRKAIPFVSVYIFACDKLQKKTHRMHRMPQVGLLSTFLCDSCITGKIEHFFKLRDDKLYTCTTVNSFDKYVYININSALLFSDLNLWTSIIKILIKTYFIIKFITNL